MSLKCSDKTFTIDEIRNESKASSQLKQNWYNYVQFYSKRKKQKLNQTKTKKFDSLFWYNQSKSPGPNPFGDICQRKSLFDRSSTDSGECFSRWKREFDCNRDIPALVRLPEKMISEKCILIFFWLFCDSPFYQTILFDFCQ